MRHAQPKKRRRALKICLFALLGAFVFCVLGGGLYAIIVYNTNHLDAALLTGEGRSILLYDRDGQLITGLSGDQTRIDLTIDQIPQQVQQAFIAAEDTRFYQHNGIDWVRLCGALWNNLRSGSLKEGGSTISQQLIKNTHLSSEKTLSRKVTEAALALQLERQYAKGDILAMYLNCIYLGNGAYGIEAASRCYFGKSAMELTLAEAATLAGITRSPSNYAPHLHPEAAVERRNDVLNRMAGCGFITGPAASEAAQQPLTLTGQSSGERQSYFVDYIVEQAGALTGLDYERVMASGYSIYTTMDARLQGILEDCYAQPELFPANATDGEKAQAATVVLDPQNGELLALMGGRDTGIRRAFNRAADMRRQPGSAIKPVLVYAPALQQGYTAATALDNRPGSFDGYTPHNFGDQYSYQVTLRTALIKSLNLPAVRVLEDVGLSTAMRYAQKVGIPFVAQDDSLALALGGFTTGVSPLQLGAAYAPFANGGSYTAPNCIRRICDAQGNVVYSADTTTTQVLDEGNAFIMTDMLRTSVQSGTARNLQLESVPLACKTGTSESGSGDGNTDAWAVAYNPALLACSWTGFDTTDAQHILPTGTTGGSSPALLLRAFYARAYENTAAPWFLQPDSVVRCTIPDPLYQAPVAPSPTAGEDATQQASTQISTIEEYFTWATYPFAATTPATALPTLPTPDFQWRRGG